jgi:hypothetical protein
VSCPLCGYPRDEDHLEQVTMSQKMLREILCEEGKRRGVSKPAVALMMLDKLEVDILTWHRAALTQYGEQVRDSLGPKVAKEFGSDDDDCQAISAWVHAQPIPPIEEGEAT